MREREREGQREENCGEAETEYPGRVTTGSATCMSVRLCVLVILQMAWNFWGEAQSVSKVWSIWDEVPTSSIAAAPTSTQCQQSVASSHKGVSDAQLQQQQQQNQSVSKVWSIWDEAATSVSIQRHPHQPNVIQAMLSLPVPPTVFVRLRHVVVPVLSTSMDLTQREG